MRVTTPLPLHDRHAAAGATFGALGARETIVTYGDTTAEVRAVRTACGVVDWCGGTRLRVTASGARTPADFLDGLLSNAVAGLGPDAGTYATLLTPTGKILADCRVWPRDDGVLVACEAAAGAVLHETLTKYGFLDELVTTDVSDACGMLGLYGPTAAEAFEAAVGTMLPGLEPDALRAVTATQGELLVTRATRTGEVGFDVLGEPKALGGLWDALTAAGVRPVGMEAFHVLRVEASVPWMGAELDDRVLPNEARLEHAVSYTKGCYVGQEAVAKLHYLGRSNRVLVGLRLGDAAPPARDTPIHAGDEEVGRVTSAAASPTLGETVALAFCRAKFAEPGSHLTVGGETSAQVAELPFDLARAARDSFREPDIRDSPSPA